MIKPRAYEFESPEREVFVLSQAPGFNETWTRAQFPFRSEIQRESVSGKAENAKKLQTHQ